MTSIQRPLLSGTNMVSWKTNLTRTRSSRLSGTKIRCWIICWVTSYFFVTSLIFIVCTILVSPVPLPMVESPSPPSQQLLEDAQVFLDGLGLIPPMGYSPEMMREDSSPLRTPSPLSCLPQLEDHP